MLKLDYIKAKSLLFLISGILALSVIFIVVSCGRGPQQKVRDSAKGHYAIDLSRAKDNGSAEAIAANAFFPSIEGNELTVEAWVKSETTALNGGIFSRYDSKGIALWVKDNEPKFAIRIGESFPTYAGVTTTPQINPDISSTIVAVIAKRSHVGIHGTTTNCTDDVRSGNHIDLYVDNTFTDCARLGGKIDTLIPNVPATATSTPSSDLYKLYPNYSYLVKAEVATAAHPTHPSSTSCDSTANQQVGHYDFYIDGKFIDCVKGPGQFKITIPTYRPTTTDYVVESNVELGSWHHIAAIVANKIHDHSQSCVPYAKAEDEIPHLDIYVDGVFKNCATTGQQGVYNPDKYASQDPTVDVADIGMFSAGGNLFDNFETTPRLFEGVIDEIRLWTVARTADQIKNCKDQELSFTGDGDCSINSSILKGYWRFNEGPGLDAKTGSMFMDSSGYGSGGSIQSPVAATDNPWNGGWVDEGWH